MKKATSFLALLLAALLLCCAAGAESYEAAAMRLLKYSGDVEILDPTGKSRFMMENGRFASGETLITGAASSASVSLDRERIVTLDEKTRTAFAQDNGYMKLSLVEGAFFLDVANKLDENETLDIETSTMTVGIRGTIVYVAERPETGVTQLTLLEGAAEMSYQDESGNRRVEQVSAGQTAVLRPTAEEAAAAVEIAPTRPDQLPAFVMEQIEASPDLGGRIDAAGGLPVAVPEDAGLNYPADGDWIYGGLVQIVARSAGKLYDGTPLSRAGDALVTGLPAEFSIRVTTSGSQTSAGSIENHVDSYAIYNAMGENVTSHFTQIQAVPGTLTVSPSPLTVWTGSAEKYYDGTPLTCAEAGIRTVEGAETDAPAWRNTAVATTGATGGAVMYGVTGSTWVHLTHPQTGEEQTVQLAAGQRLTVSYAPREDGQAEIKLLIEPVNQADLPAEVLAVYAANPEMLSRACQDAGWNEQDLQAVVAQATGEAPETLLTESVDVRLSTDSFAASGTTRILGNREAAFTAVSVPASVKVTATGSQTEVGESLNTYEIEWGGEDPNNFRLQEELGLLTVRPRPQPDPEPEPEPINDPVTLTAGSAEKEYDGTPLTSPVVEVSGVPAGYRAEASAKGSRTDAGEAENIVTSYAFYDADGKDVTALFTNVTTAAGTLTVHPAELTVQTASAEKAYDGTALTAPEVTLKGLAAGETATAAATGSLTDVGTAENGYTLDWGTAKKKNYTLSEQLGTLTVTPNDTEITFTATIATRDYDGTPLTATADSVTVTGLPAGFTWTAEVTGSQTGAGSSESEITAFRILNTARAEASEDATAFFTGVKTVKGTLTVNPVPLAITTASATRVYDGTPLTAPEATITGLVAGETATVTGTGTLTAVGTASNGYTVDWGATNSANYTVSESLGTLTVTPAPLLIVTPSASKAYDGTPLTAPTVEITGLASGETMAAVAEVSLTLVGTADNVYSIDWGDTDPNNYSITEEIGTLEVTPSSAEILITAASADKVYDGTALLSEDYTITGFTAYEGNHFIVAAIEGSQTDAGSCANQVSGYTIYNLAEEDVTACFTNVKTAEGNLTVLPKEIQVTTASAEKAYDGTPLTSPAAEITGLVADETATATGTGTITELGETVNPVEITWGTAKESNYIVTEVQGTLKVTENDTPVTITSGTYAWEYKLYNTPETKTYEVSGALPAGVSLEVTFGEITWTPCVQDNAFSFVIRDGNGEDKTDNFTGVTAVFGTLTITKAKINVWSDDRTVTYTGGLFDAGTVHYQGVYGVDGPMNSVYITYTDSVRDAGTWTPGFTATVRSDLEDKYELGELTFGTLTIEPAPLTVTTTTAEKLYDGTALTGEATLTGLMPYDSGVTVTATGSQTDAGSCENGYSIAWGSSKESNYVITSEELGTLTVQKRTVTLTSATASRGYDGTALTAQTVTVGGDGFAPGEGVDEFYGWFAQTAVGSMPNYFQYSLLSNTKAENYSISKIEGTLTVEKLRLTVYLGGRTVVYDGNVQGFDFTAVSITIENGYPGQSVTAGPMSAVVGRANYTYTLDQPALTIDLEVIGSGTEKGTYDISGTVTFSGGDESNIEVSYTNDVLTIQ